ncbi:MAG: radical SAM protein [Candidatus Omnitrophota bacterium]
MAISFFIMKKYYTIPFFIPHRGCPHQCIFCNQKNIAGEAVISPNEVSGKIEKYLKHISSSNAEVEVGFFGGSFTGLPAEMQDSFLVSAQRYLEKGLIRGIRLSTRPDLINENILNFLRDHGVTCIELGVQSMFQDVLSASGRGHTVEDTERASKLILKHGFVLGHQMMLGLPLSSEEKEFYTAQRANELGAKEVRIYPVLVIRGTVLEDLWRESKYKPLEAKEAVKRSAFLLMYFESVGIKVIRCGLHPAPGLISGEDFLAGPFHPAFRQKAESLIFTFMLDRIIRDTDKQVIKAVSFNPQDEAAFFGFKGQNQFKINELIGKNRDLLIRDLKIPKGCVRVKTRNRELVVRRSSLVSRLTVDG